MTARRAHLLSVIRGGRVSVPSVLTATELRALLQISEATFYRWKRAGMFDRLEAADIPHRYARAKVDAWIAGKPKGRVA